VTTSLGAEGLDLNGREAAVVDDVGGIATKVIGLLDAPQLARSIAASARERVERDFDWDASATALEGTLARSVSRVANPPGARARPRRTAA
jgi:glycosyltransferase involved in cell wall biosynthesis